MEKKVVGFLSGFSMLWMLVCILVLCRNPNFHERALSLSDEDTWINGGSVLSMLRDDSQLVSITNEPAYDEAHQLRLEIPSSVDLDDITMEKSYMAKEIILSLPGVGDTYFYDYPMIGKTDGISDMRYEVHDHVGVLDIFTNHVVEPVLEKNGKYLYLDFTRPRKLYDYIVVIDAGHGSKDPGAVQGNTYEKDITLGIVKQLKKIFDKDKHNIGVYYTRLKDENPKFPDRVGLSNDTNADVFVSVHINSTASGRLSGIRGTSVLYMVADKSGASKELAQGILDNLLLLTGAESRGLVPGDEMYVLRNNKSPSVLCEVGFLTNPEEKALLETKEYQKKAAQGIYLGILKHLGIDGGDNEEN